MKNKWWHQLVLVKVTIFINFWKIAWNGEKLIPNWIEVIKAIMLIFNECFSIQMTRPWIGKGNTQQTKWVLHSSQASTFIQISIFRRNLFRIMFPEWRRAELVIASFVYNLGLEIILWCNITIKLLLRIPVWQLSKLEVVCYRLFNIVILIENIYTRCHL